MLCNVDRHPKNFLVSTENKKPKVWAIDHSHCPVHPALLPETVAHLADYDLRKFVIEPVAASIRDIGHLRRALNRAMSLTSSVIDLAMDGGRLEAWTDADTRAVRDFLLQRQASLPDLIGGRDDIFPCLKGVNL